MTLHLALLRWKTNALWRTFYLGEAYSEISWQLTVWNVYYIRNHSECLFTWYPVWLISWTDIWLGNSNFRHLLVLSWTPLLTRWGVVIPVESFFWKHLNRYNFFHSNINSSLYVWWCGFWNHGILCCWPVIIYLIIAIRRDELTMYTSPPLSTSIHCTCFYTVQYHSSPPHTHLWHFQHLLHRSSWWLQH